MHDEAIRAAAEGMKKAEPWSEFWDDNDAEALARAAITAFLVRVEVSPGMGAAALNELSDGTVDAPKAAAWDATRAFHAMLAQLRREL